LSYGFVTDLLQYDALPYAQKLTMPVSVYVGTHDTLCSEDDCMRLRTHVGLHARVVVVPNLSHTPHTHEALYSLTHTLTHGSHHTNTTSP
jgi:pimeloyl-ACP methyl ester carboxylesterase